MSEGLAVGLPAYRSVLADLPGCVIDEGGAGLDALPGAPGVPGVPLHFGDPSGEQWALEAGRGIVDRGDMAAVRVSGPDRQTWLTSLTSQVVTGMGPGDSRELLVLDPQGHVEHAAAAVDDGEATWLLTDRSRAGALAEWLDSMRFMLRVEVGVADEVAMFTTVGAPSLDGLSDLPGFLATWADPWPGVSEGGTEYHRSPHPARQMQFFIHMVSSADAWAFARGWLDGGAGRLPAGYLAWEALRVAAWRPSIAREVDARTIPAELDWLRTAVHTDKGCYRGQESVARVINLGRPPRRLVFLHLDGLRGDVPAVGAPIERAGRRVGTVTSVARHADFGPIALAVVARNVPADTVFDLDGVAAAQEVIVPVDGRCAASPIQRPGVGLGNPELRRPGPAAKLGKPGGSR